MSSERKQKKIKGTDTVPLPPPTDVIIQQNNIPVFSPAITDGALGDTLYFHSYKNPGLVIDIVEGKWIIYVQLYVVLRK